MSILMRSVLWFMRMSISNYGVGGSSSGFDLKQSGESKQKCLHFALVSGVNIV
jgi:hypothetical protein